MHLWIRSLSIGLALSVGCAPGTSSRLSTVAADPEGVVDAALERHSVEGDLEASVFLAGASGPPVYARHDTRWRPAASAIKTAYLIEFFARHADDLDAPIGDVSPLLLAAEHPAIRHFSPEQQAEIAGQLIGASARRLGDVMIHGVGVSNAVYNAAANVITALLGGPEALTEAIRDRFGGDAGFAARRYMLARRDVTGDNELTTRALGVLWQRIARGDVPGIDAATLTAIRDVLELEGRPGEYSKSGALDSHPPVRLRTGWVSREGEDVVYVVVVTPRPGSGAAGEEVGKRLAAAAGEIVSGMLLLGDG